VERADHAEFVREGRAGPSERLSGAAAPRTAPIAVAANQGVWIVESLFWRLHVGLLRANLALRGFLFQCFLNVRKNRLERADLSYLNLSRYNLRRANLREANLICTNLNGADLTDASLEGADLRGASLRGANLAGARLMGATATLAQLAKAKSLEGTTLPNGRLYHTKTFASAE
jgi:uncharacterized protein YjbI with pentapeptide repeats